MRRRAGARPGGGSVAVPAGGSVRMAPVLRSALKVLGAGDVDAALASARATPSRTSSWPPGSIGLRGEPRRPAGEVWGWYDRRRAALGLLVGRQPRAGGGDAGRRRGVRRSARGGTAATAPRSSGRPAPSSGCGGTCSRRGARPGRCAAHQPLMAMSGPPRVVARPARAPYAPGRDRARAAGLRRDVHRGGRVLAGGGRRRHRSTGRRSPAWSSAGRSFARLDDGPGERQVVFKAELGSVTPRRCRCRACG